MCDAARFVITPDAIADARLINIGEVRTPRRSDDSVDVDRVVLLVRCVLGDLSAVNERCMLAIDRPG